MACVGERQLAAGRVAAVRYLEEEDRWGFALAGRPGMWFAPDFLVWKEGRQLDCF